ncbi:hypothetical protein QBC35DRAFT_511134 [Podospora australis]|uniref:Pentatricopeptide repeat protein n=1 Tax=Podospora australis TaxID=1536484 RepID=A0AAN6X4W1_9PEZI|nr:hypothetical protein QBC35DRAFT_511134 [Podospora australis]
MFVCRACTRRLIGVRNQIPIASRLLRPSLAATSSFSSSAIFNRPHDSFRALKDFESQAATEPPATDQPESNADREERLKEKWAAQRQKKKERKQAQRSAEVQAFLEPAPPASVLSVEDVQDALGGQAKESENTELSTENIFQEEDVKDDADSPVDPNNEQDQKLLKVRKIVKKHLTWLKDPLDIAQHIRKTLDKGGWDEALMMARTVSVNTKAEVSWNHLIDYQLKQGRLHAAIKLYNEMKKRGQRPNARTYTIIFRGCAESHHPQLAVSEAVRIYNTLLTRHAGTNFEPNTIHMNSVLEVCARANDLDSMFTILGTANNSRRAPDALSFTIVLNALRHQPASVRYGPNEFADVQIKKNIQVSIQKAKALWDDIISRWRGGRLFLDEGLVCAMGHVMAAGDYVDNANIFPMLEQTMQIPLPDVINKTLLRLAKPPKPRPETSTDVDAEGTHSEQPREIPTRSTSAAAPEGNGSYVKPGQRTLSLTLTSLTNTNKTSYAGKYWQYFTEVHKIKPDVNNYACYLKCLRVGHSSNGVAKLILSMPQEFLSPLTFRVGFGTCIKDKLNQNAYDNACRIFEVMIAKSRYPDNLAMRLFLHVARIARVRCPGEKDEGYGRQLYDAIDRMWGPMDIILRSFSYLEKPTKSPEEALERNRGEMQEAMATARAMISVMDIICNQRLATPKASREIRIKRKVLNLSVERFILKLYPNGPPGRESQGEKDAELLKQTNELGQLRALATAL